ncbi:hypothetical protein AU191_08890 [Mycolicibacterium acapulense]|nr:hypothetical protein AU191_08890 [Mycolicibacterium acapulense]
MWRLPRCNTLKVILLLRVDRDRRLLFAADLILLSAGRLGVRDRGGFLFRSWGITTIEIARSHKPFAARGEPG